jgi:hypothetical protein
LQDITSQDTLIGRFSLNILIEVQYPEGDITSQDIPIGRFSLNIQIEVQYPDGDITLQDITSQDTLIGRFSLNIQIEVQYPDGDITSQDIPIGRFSLTVKQGLNLWKWPTHNTRKFLNVTINRIRILPMCEM